MKKEESRNIIAPMLNITLSINGSPALNLRTVRLSPANVPGRDAMIMGSVNLSFSSALISGSTFPGRPPEPASYPHLVHYDLHGLQLVRSKSPRALRES